MCFFFYDGGGGSGGGDGDGGGGGGSGSFIRLCLIGTFEVCCISYFVVFI